MQCHKLNFLLPFYMVPATFLRRYECIIWICCPGTNVILTTIAQNSFAVPVVLMSFLNGAWWTIRPTLYIYWHEDSINVSIIDWNICNKIKWYLRQFALGDGLWLPSAFTKRVLTLYLPENWERFHKFPWALPFPIKIFYSFVQCPFNSWVRNWRYRVQFMRNLLLISILSGISILQ